MNSKVKKELIKKHSPGSTILKNLLLSFTFGGAICVLGQLLFLLFEYLSLDEKTSGILVTVTLIFIAALLTALGIFDRIAKFAGAGTLVPITGFANAVVSPAIDAHSEGLILGVGAKIFTVAGPVLLYGTLAGTVYGVVYWISKMF